MTDLDLDRLEALAKKSIAKNVSFIRLWLDEMPMLDRVDVAGIVLSLVGLVRQAEADAAQLRVKLEQTIDTLVAMEMVAIDAGFVVEETEGLQGHCRYVEVMRSVIAAYSYAEAREKAVRIEGLREGFEIAKKGLHLEAPTRDWTEGRRVLKARIAELDDRPECTECDGAGWTWNPSGIQDDTRYTCQECGGEGRIRELEDQVKP